MARGLKEIVVNDAFSGMRLDAFLAACEAFVTRSAAAKAISHGEVVLDGVPARKSDVVHCGQVVAYESPDVPTTRLVPADIELDIRYEDDHIIVLSKQPNLVCHPADGHDTDTLVNALIARFGAENLCDVQGEQDRLGIVHRLDRDTSGLMLAAKTNEAGLALMDAIRVREVDRHYITLVHGWIPLETGMVDAPIARSIKDRQKMRVADTPSARSAVTTFNVLKRFEAGAHDDGFTLLDCKLFSGRTHQIRVHMQYIKHPCVGDPVYGYLKKDNLTLDRQFLHSYKLSFNHPITGEYMYFEDSLPADLQDVLDELEARS